MTRDSPRPPVFVVGASRSGTNLLRALLNAHSAALGVGRDALLRRPAPAAARRGPAGGRGATRAVRAVLPRALAPRVRPAGRPGGEPDRPRRAARARRRARRHRRRVLRGALPAARAAPRQAALGGEDAAPRLPDRRHARGVPGGEGRLRRARPARGDRVVPRLARRGARQGVEERAEKAADRSGRGARTTSSSSACSGAASCRRRTRRCASTAPERVRVERFEELAAEPEAGGARALRVARPRVRAGDAGDPGREQLVRDVGRAAGVSSEPVERWRSRLSPKEVGIVQSVCGAQMDELGYARDAGEGVAARARVGVDDGAVRGRCARRC